jgi:transposase
MYGCGPRLTALTAQLSGGYRLSRRETAALLSEVLSVPICKGTVHACCERVSDAQAEPVDEVAAALPDQDVVHMDETGWKVACKRAWLWLFSSATFAYFATDPRRGRAILERLFPGGHPETVNSDRWSAYSFFSALRRQLCWSHLLRDLQGIAGAKGLGSRPAKAILKAADQMFSDLHAFRREEITRAELAERIAPLRVSLMVFAEAGVSQKKDRK